MQNLEASTTYECPHCRSNTTQAVSMVWRTGTTTGQISATSVAVGSRGTVGIASTTGTQDSSTVLASALAPPVEPKAPRSVLIAGRVLVAIPLLMFLAALVPTQPNDADRHNSAASISDALRSGAESALACAFLVLVPATILLVGYSVAIRDLPERRARWRDLLMRFQHDWICLRCGHRWTPGEAARKAR